MQGQGAGLLGHHPRDNRLRRRPGERGLADEHLVQHAAQRVEIGLGRDLPLPHRLLGTHVVRCSEGHARLGHPGAAGAAHRQGDPEVGHQRAAIVQQHVLGLDVSVDHPMAVGVVERSGHLGGDPHRLGDGQLLLPSQPVTERLPLHEWHHVVDGAVDLPGVVQRQDVRMLQIGGGLDLARNRSAPITAASSGRRTLMATFRSCLRSWARYTVAMPPCPSSRSIR